MPDPEDHITAESLFEAAALALRALEAVGAKPGPAAHLEIAAQMPVVSHSVKVQRVRDWLNSGGKSPREQALKWLRGTADESMRIK